MARLAARVSEHERLLMTPNSYAAQQAAVPAPASVRKPRVAILGLINGQTGIVQARAGHLADLQFVDKDRQIGNFPQSAECVVVVKKFIDHAWINAAYRRFGSDRLYHANGGINS